MSPSFLTDTQLRAELARCHFCETRPCRTGCPAGCSPADFIMAARAGEASDLRRAAAHILAHNPLGGVCGAVCPDTLCMARCTRRALDRPVDIPAVQAAIVHHARQLGVVPRSAPLPGTGQRVAVVGAGPAGLGAASVLAKAGHTVHVLDRARRPGGMARLIPRTRLDPEVLATDVEWLLGLGDVHLALGRPVALPRDLLARGYAAVIVTAGLSAPVGLDVPGHDRALGWAEVLGDRPPALRGRRVAVIGDGPVALDCAEAALARGAAHVELLAQRKLSELELGRGGRERLFASGVHLSGRVRVTAIRGRGARVTALELCRVTLPAGEAFHPSRLVDLAGGEHVRRDLDTVIVATGSRPGLRREPHPRILYAGDLETGPTSVVEALASGKRAGLEVHRLLAGEDLAACPDRTSCPDGSACPKRATCPEWNDRPTSADRPASAARVAAGIPVPVSVEFLGRELASPFLLAAGPATAGYAPLRRAYASGWAGAVIEATPDALDGVCRGLERLRQEFPDRLTVAALRVPATGDDGADTRAWQASVARLEAAGAAGIQCSVSGPEDGDPAAEEPPDDPALAARIAGWVLPASDPAVPKLFEVRLDSGLAGPALAAVAEVLGRHPDRRAGVTLAGVGPDRTIAAAVRLGLCVSRAADLQDHHAAARALALGVRTVQLGGVVTRYGPGIVSELHAGLSWLLAERALPSVAALTTAAGGRLDPRDEAPAVCTVDAALCAGCGNCARCLHLAIALDARGVPDVDADRCVGCGTCVEQCVTGALALRPAA